MTHLIGWLSDRTPTPWGRRLPWLLAGALPFGLLFVLQWWVPPGLGNGALFAYYVTIGVLFNLAYTTVNLPYTALTPELTADDNERTNLNGFRFAFSLGGSILSLLLADRISQGLPDNPAGEHLLLGSSIALLSTLPILWCALSIRERGARALLTRPQRLWLGTGLLGVALAISVAVGIAFARAMTMEASLLLALGVLLATFGITLLRVTPEVGIV